MDKVTDVILVKKHYGDRSQLRKNRVWKLKHLSDETTNFNTMDK